MIYINIFKGIFMVYIILFLVSLPGYSKLTSCFLKFIYPVLKETQPQIQKALIKHQYESFITLDVKLIFFVLFYWGAMDDSGGWKVGCRKSSDNERISGLLFASSLWDSNCCNHSLSKQFSFLKPLAGLWSPHLDSRFCRKLCSPFLICVSYYNQQNESGSPQWQWCANMRL